MGVLLWDFTTWVPLLFACLKYIKDWSSDLASTYLLHDVELGVLCLKQLDKQLQHLWVQQLVTRADLERKGEGSV